MSVSTTGGASSGWSEPAWFETALLRAADWRGHWIAGPERQTTPLSLVEGVADDSVIRAAREFCRPPRWLTSGFAARLVRNNQRECREIRPAPMREYVHTAQILPLAFGLVPDDRRAAVAARLAEDIRTESGGNAYVGILGARYVLPVLTANGYHDLAYTVATQTDEPSWGYWTDVAGFTALGEHWPADTRSRNHHMFGAIVQWLYEDLAGMRPLEPGYASIEFRPEIPTAGLDSVTASYESVRGPVAARWKRTAAGLEMDVTVPANATGRVYVPARTPGGVSAPTGSAAAAVRLVGVEGDRVVYEVGSGQHRFRVPARR